MLKQTSFNLFEDQVKQYKNLVDKSVQSKILRNFILNDFMLPQDLSVVMEQGERNMKVELFAFDQDTNTKLNQLIKDIESQGFKANRSLLMRYILDQLIRKLETTDIPVSERKVHLSSYYFEKGTKDLLNQFAVFRDRNLLIERFIIEEYKPNKNITLLLEKPEDPEAIRIGISNNAIGILDEFVKELNVKGVTRTALMRDVCNQLIGKITNRDAAKIIVDRRLVTVIKEYTEVYGQDNTIAKLKEYLKAKE
ncbi:hypothetical protein [Alkalihalobacillus sp. LMS39]|uniref:hypothetical protein n=1 Tax=Alkalihalobacillus sp. LMS39 TaxID=2924032 RepID=UPI001FB40FA5|nr:hypothetical protein [Alkalihalobacillus sp. LMS39]UOE95092.1 hypothetical protein MM271_05555 [Alkalihalobacillus sp. LMS39]